MASTDLNITIDALFSRALNIQRQIQSRHMGGDPAELPHEVKRRFIRDMTLATVVELAEALDETRWKPWAKFDPTQPVVNREKFRGELADVFIFLMNLMLVGDITVSEFMQAVDAKQNINIKRQLEGYDGNSTKCPACKKAYDDPAAECFDREHAPTGEHMPHNAPLVVGWCGTKNGYVNAAGTIV